MIVSSWHCLQILLGKAVVLIMILWERLIAIDWNLLLFIEIRSHVIILLLLLSLGLCEAHRIWIIIANIILYLFDLVELVGFLSLLF